MLKKLLIGVMGVALLLGAGLLWAMRDIGPVHPVLRAADLPPLIPTRTFYADTDAAWDFVASPDATYLAVKKPRCSGADM